MFRFRLSKLNGCSIVEKHQKRIFFNDLAPLNGQMDQINISNILFDQLHYHQEIKVQQWRGEQCATDRFWPFYRRIYIILYLYCIKEVLISHLLKNYITRVSSKMEK